MPAGFEANTDTGVVQVVSDRSNFHLRHKFDINEPGSVVLVVAGQTVTRAVSRDFYASNPVVAATGPRTNFGLSVVLQPIGGGVWRVTAYTSDQYTVFGTIFIFDSVVDGSGNAGIEVYNSNGTLSFASWAKPMRVVGVSTSPFGTAAGQWFPVPPGRRYAVVSSRSCQRIERGTGFRLTGPQGDGTGSTNGRFFYAGNNALIPWGDNATEFSCSGHFFFVDVTGY